MTWSSIELGFDAYERRARLFPSLLVTFPFATTMLLLKPAAITSGFGKTLIAASGYAGVLYLLANIARAEGKKIQPRLLNEWEGWPSTILLRHRDSTLDAHTKGRYHAALSKLVPISMPSEQQEIADPESADAVYRSATNHLIELRRDKEYRLIHDANAEYGFRRNILGMRRWGICVSAGTAVLLGLMWAMPLQLEGTTLARLLDDLRIRWKLYALFIANVGALFFWAFYVRKAWVRQSAFDYALALFRTLESSQQRAKATARRTMSLQFWATIRSRGYLFCMRSY